MSGHARTHEGDGRNVAHLEIALRDVDTDDLRTYAHVDDLRQVGEYVRAMVDVRYEQHERGAEWPN